MAGEVAADACAVESGVDVEVIALWGWWWW